MRTYSRLEDTPIWKLFNFYWSVSAPYIHVLPDGYVDTYGTFTSGDKRHDEATLLRMCECQLPAVRDPDTTPQIKSILELVLDGVPVQFHDAHKVGELYDLLLEHVQLLASYFNESLFFTQRAIEASPEKQRVVQDALDLQTLINHLHPIVERYRPVKDTAPSDFLQMLEYWRKGVASGPLLETEERHFAQSAPDVFTTALSGLGKERIRAWR